jgi:hypothetical protein
MFTGFYNREAHMASTQKRINNSTCWKNFSNPDDIKTYQALLVVGEVLKDRGRKQQPVQGNEFHSPKLAGIQSGIKHLGTFTQDRCLYWGTGRMFDAWVIQEGCEHKLEELGLTIPEGLGEIMYPDGRAIIVPSNKSMSFIGDGYRYASLGSSIIAPPTRFDTFGGQAAYWSKPLKFTVGGIENPEIVMTLAKRQYQQAGKHLPLSSADQQRMFAWDRDIYEEILTSQLLEFVKQQALGISAIETQEFISYMSFAVHLNSSQTLKTKEDIEKGFIQMALNIEAFKGISPMAVLDICSQAFTRSVAYRSFTSPVEVSENP